MNRPPTSRGDDSLWVAVPAALRRFNRASLVRTAPATAALLAGARRAGSAERPLVLTCSIWEDQARLWWHLARRHLDASAWDVLIIDSSGSFCQDRFPGARVLRCANVYHGKRLDWLLGRCVRADLVFVMDDDKYLTGSPAPFLSLFDDPKVAAVSLQPRRWWHFDINGERHLPMGSYALLLRRSVLRAHRLRLRPSPGPNPHKVTHPPAKAQPSFDTADLANLRLLQLGYRVVTVADRSPVTGFDGMTAPRVLAREWGADHLRRTLTACEHFRDGSISGAVIRGLYCAASFEALFERVFREPPCFRLGLEVDALRRMVEEHETLEELDRRELLGYFDRIDHVRTVVVEALR